MPFLLGGDGAGRTPTQCSPIRPCTPPHAHRAPLRAELHHELRPPPEALSAPLAVLHCVMWADAAARQQSPRPSGQSAGCRRSAGAAGRRQLPSRPVAWLTLRWEQHTEFVAWTFCGRWRRPTRRRCRPAHRATMPMRARGLAGRIARSVPDLAAPVGGAARGRRRRCRRARCSTPAASPAPPSSATAPTCTPTCACRPTAACACWCWWASTRPAA